MLIRYEELASQKAIQGNYLAAGGQVRYTDWPAIQAGMNF